ncbi:MAG: hypothetical protein V4450_14745 [Bacteroidota bacterium]
MKTKLLILLAIPVLFYACKKDAYTTKPQLSVKSISSTTLSQGNLLLFQIEFTDKEGDIQDTLWVQKVSRACPTSSGAQFLSPYKVPNFTPTSNLKGILEIGYGYNANVQGYQTITGCNNRNDTGYFRFWLKDKAQNVSDTLVTQNIVFLK